MHYLDNASATPVSSGVIAEMEQYLTKTYGNPSTWYHEQGLKAKEAMDSSFNRIMESLKAPNGSVTAFYSQAEANNAAVDSFAVPSCLQSDHSSVYDSISTAKRQYFLYPVDKQGIVDTTFMQASLKQFREKVGVSVGHANIEIGTVQDIKEISKIVHEYGGLLHVDLTASLGQEPIDLKSWGADMATISGHTIHGPRIAALWVREGVPFKLPTKGARTEDVAGIAGLAFATEIAVKDRPKVATKLKSMRDRLIKGVLEVPDSWLNGHPTQRLPGNAHFGFDYIEGESLAMALDMDGIQVATGSACSSASLKASHVLSALGLPPVKIHGSMRVSLAKQNTTADVDALLAVLPPTIKRFREMSAFKPGMKEEDFEGDTHEHLH